MRFNTKKRLIVGLLCLIFCMTNLSANNIYATFDVEASKSANLAFSSGGIVKNVLVDVTSEIKKDEIIARLQNDDLKAKLEASKVALKYAKLDYNRQFKVRKIIDKAKFDKFAFKYESAKVQVKYDKSILEKTILKAPFDGVIYEKLVEEGDVVSGQAIRTILKIQSKSERKLVLKFDQKYNHIVKVGNTFSYKIDGDDTEYEGKIYKIYPYVDSANRKIKAEVHSSNILVGLFGDGYILVKEKE